MTTHDPELVELVAEAVLDAWTDELEDWTKEDIARAVLDAITTSPRHALVELPEADSTRYDEGEDAEFPPADRLGWLRGMGLYGVTFWPECAGEVQVAYNNEPGEPLSPSEAKRLGAALLAAARVAESGSTTPETRE
ncbi:MAG: hypothetical protein WDA07_15225 [Leucobacter sp.]